MEQFPNPPTDEQAPGREQQDPNVQGSNQPNPNPPGQDLPDALTTAALLLLPREIGEQYLRLWQTSQDRDATALLVRETVRLLQLTEANARARPETSANATIPGRDERAEADKKRALLKTIPKIRAYAGKIQGDAAREYLYDCERYFQQVAEFSTSALIDRERIMYASGALSEKALKSWRGYERQVAEGYETAILTWQSYKDWINREFSEHLSAAKRWNRFKTLRQGKGQPFMEYATRLRQAAIECEQTIPDPIFVEFLRDGAQLHLQRRWAEERKPPTDLHEIIERFKSYEEGATLASFYAKQAPNSGDAMDLSAMTARPERQDARKCFNCGKIGHIGRNCPRPRRERGNRKRLEESEN